MSDTSDANYEFVMSTQAHVTLVVSVCADKRAYVEQALQRAGIEPEDTWEADGQFHVVVPMMDQVFAEQAIAEVLT